MAIKLLIGGSPCTHWSIAQKNNRETEPSGVGWELFNTAMLSLLERTRGNLHKLVPSGSMSY